MLRRHFINLTNGIENLPRIVNESWSFCRIRSTTIEHKKWFDLFYHELSDDLLMHLALGYECVLHDRGTRRPISKTCFYAVPLIKFVLEKFWFNLNPLEIYICGPYAGHNILNKKEEFNDIYDTTILDKSHVGGNLRKRLRYFKYFCSNITSISFTCVSSSTINDGNDEYFKKILRKIGQTDV